MTTSNSNHSNMNNKWTATFTKVLLITITLLVVVNNLVVRTFIKMSHRSRINTEIIELLRSLMIIRRNCRCKGVFQVMKMRVLMIGIYKIQVKLEVAWWMFGICNSSSNGLSKLQVVDGTMFKISSKCSSSSNKYNIKTITNNLIVNINRLIIINNPLLILFQILKTIKCQDLSNNNNCHLKIHNFLLNLLVQIRFVKKDLMT